MLLLPNIQREYDRITQFIREKNELLGTAGAVVGISGGVDSSVCAKLVVDVVGPKKCLGIIMPAPDSNPKDKEDAIVLANFLNIETICHPLNNLLSNFKFKNIDYKKEIEPILLKGELLPTHLEDLCTMKMRGRMYILSYYARTLNYFQCQTLEKTEWMLGWFDKFSDAAGDIAPIFHLYKTQVYQLAKYLNIPKVNFNKPPGPGTYPITDEEILGMSFVEADTILYNLAKEFSIYDIVVITSINLDKVKRIKNMVDDSFIKRDIPFEIEKWKT